MFRIIGYIVVGLIVGVFARFFYPGAVDLGWIATILLGIGGGIIGGFFAGLMDGKSGNFRPVGFIGSVLGGMLLIFIVRSLS
ncbi:GlsB/YeaQ/YmgE family stress response membrane protein [Sphingobium sp. B11D3A]|uniref:GlsB/YeaQ/YmgE family stress response membrane protein n=1 Tax=Sphingobium sp. B11D3A TaxID=2940574 RepID=UPI0022248FC3|nr:GlsB/YeaQ/YmgE family stress response membrane protein [Sphingobium sp. B11D3A]MCW2391503.1 putative membrane protein YeaQ/YmgE (transglycosylase-associated protein family) [Sphingobium sp. B11D3A]